MLNGLESLSCCTLVQHRVLYVSNYHGIQSQTVLIVNTKLCDSMLTAGTGMTLALDNTEYSISVIIACTANGISEAESEWTALCHGFVMAISTSNAVHR